MAEIRPMVMRSGRVLPLVIALLALAQPIILPAAVSPPWETSEIGAVWSDNFNRATLGTNWVILGSANASIVGNELRFVHANNVTSRQVYYEPWLTCADHWTIRWSQRFDTLDANSVGLGVGIKNFQAEGGNDQGYNAFLSGTGATQGKMILARFDGSVHHTIDTGPSIGLAAGNQVDCSITRSGWTISATASNRANGLVSTASLEFYSSPAELIPPISRMCFYPFSGTVYVTNLSFSLDRRKPARFVVIGGSIGDGEGSSGYAKSFTQAVQTNFNEAVCNESGSWNSTVNSLSLVPEILACQPGTAILTIGANDVFYGYPTSQWQENYTNLVRQLETNGVKVKHCLPTPETIKDQRPLKNWLLATYPAADIIDHWTPFVVNNYQLKSMYDSGDGVHPNDSGHLLLGQIIISNLPPGIRTHPGGLVSAAGANPALTVSATGASPLSYQWRFNGGSIPGATGTSLTLTNVQGTNAGYYTAVVSNPNGSTTSAVAALTVRIPLLSVSVAFDPEQDPRLTFVTTSNINCRIDASTNLAQWTVVTNIATSNGTLQFVDPFAPNFPQHFYRAFSLP